MGEERRWHGEDLACHGMHGHGRGDQATGGQRHGEASRGAEGGSGGQRWTWSKPKCSMGFKFPTACKVFVVMPEREKVSNFGNSLGGSQTYNHRSRLVVVVVILVKNCKMAKVR
jgi:hypothetical protein